jgi:hypothetical protein
MATRTLSDHEVVRGDRLLEARRDAWTAELSKQLATVAAVLTVGVALLLLCWSRLANLQTGFWNDEAYTALKYADPGPRAIFDGAIYVPNNHVLFSLATWATTHVFGRFEAAYRIWSVLPALIAVVLVAWWARRFFDSLTAVVIVVLAAVSEVHLVLAPQARGYGLAMLAGAGMLIGAIRADQLRRRDGIVIFALSGLVGICTLPVFVLAFVFQAVVLFAKRELRRATLAACALVSLASGIFYAPLVRGILDSSDQRVGEQLPWLGFLTGPYRHLAKPTLAPVVPHVATTSLVEDVILLFVTSALVIFGGARLLRRDTSLCLQVVVPVIGTYLALTAARFYVGERFTSFLLFHVIVLLAVGVSAVWDAISRWRALKPLAAAVGVVAFVVGGHYVVQETRSQARQPWENFQAVREIVNSTGIRRVYSNGAPVASLEYYVGSNRVTPLIGLSLTGNLHCELAGPFILVARHAGVQPDVSCLRQRGAVDMRIPQQTDSPVGPRPRIDVWVIPSGAPRASELATPEQMLTTSEGAS